MAQSIEGALNEARQGMDKSLGHLRQEMNSIRTGRASPAMLENVRVEYYGSQVPLNQVATISAPQADLLLVQPFDTSALEDVEKGIMQANLGLNPSNDGTIIRVPVPPLSEERRKELAKRARTLGEETKVALRNVRRSAKDEIKRVQEEQNLSEDNRYAGEEDLQSMTDEYTGKVDTLLDKKEQEIMKV